MSHKNYGLLPIFEQAPQKIKTMKRRTGIFLLLALIGLALFTQSCEEDSLVAENPAPTGNNVRLQPIMLYEGQKFDSDTMLTNAFGNEFFIDSVKFLISSFFFVNPSTKDTFLQDDLNIYAFPNSQNFFEQRIATMLPGDYSGFPHIVIGLDDSLSVLPPALVDDHNNVLESAQFRRNDGLGYNHFQIYGRMRDPFFVDDTTFSLPLRFQLGTALLTDTFKANNAMNFGVDGSRLITFIMPVDIGPMLNSFDMDKPDNEVKSNITEARDFELARKMMDTLAVDIF